VQPIFRRSVSFHSCVTVYTFIDNVAAERKGPWMRIAVDSERFRRRIKVTELLLGYIFSDIHRENILCYVNKNMKE